MKPFYDLIRNIDTVVLVLITDVIKTDKLVIPISIKSWIHTQASTYTHTHIYIHIYIHIPLIQYGCEMTKMDVFVRSCPCNYLVQVWAASTEQSGTFVIDYLCFLLLNILHIKLQYCAIGYMFVLLIQLLPLLIMWQTNNRRVTFRLDTLKECFEVAVWWFPYGQVVVSYAW